LTQLWRDGALTVIFIRYLFVSACQHILG